MAAIGLRGAKYGIYTVTDGVISYTGSRAFGKTISADLSVEVAEVILYDEDEEDEVIKEFAGGTLSIGVKELDYTAQADLYGHTRTAPGEGTPERLLANADDNAKAVGTGFYVPVVRGNGERWFRAFFLTRVVFGEPALSFKTKEKTLTFATPTTVGTVTRDKNRDWKDETMHATAEAASAWINTKLGIVSP